MKLVKKSLILFVLFALANPVSMAQHPIQHSIHNSERPQTIQQRIPQTNKPQEHLVEIKSYEVSVICNEPKAFISIDDRCHGTGGGSWLLKEGLHRIRLSAANCFPIVDTLTVGPDSHSFTYTLKRDYSLLPSAIQNLIKNMVYVEGGTFMMGEASNIHQVTVSSFSIGKYEVTQEEWQAVMGDNPSYYKKEKISPELISFGLAHNDLPVESVSWDDCEEFIQKLNSMTGKNFRMPTETEWEYAARGGNRSKDYKYVGSNTLDDVAWYQSNSDMRTTNVGLKSPNELGLYDMCGNVWEWCSGNYSFKDIYGTAEQTNTDGSSSGFYRVYRGCGFMTVYRHCNVWERLGAKSNERSSERGLRLAL